MRGCWSGLSRIGVRDTLSCQSLMPVGAGTPRCEKPELWLGTANSHGGFCCAPPQPQRGTSPRATFSHSAIGLQFGRFRRWRAGSEVDWRAHPGSESGTCFHSNRSCRLAPAHQGMKSGSCGLAQRIGTADSATPHPDPSGGQAPALRSPLPTPLDSGLRRNDE